MALALFGAIVAHAVWPDSMAWARLGLPRPLRWLGLLLGVLTLPAVHRVLSALGPNVTETVLTKDQHQLVTEGPYRWVRHPLYTTGLALFFALGLMTASWFVLLATVVAFALIRMLVIPREEQALLAKFGERYQVYRLTTGRLLPKLGEPVLMKVATWTAGALAFGWLATVAALLFSDEGHPPLWYFLGAGVVLAAFLLAPIGAGAAFAGLWRARSQGTRAPRLTMAALGVNLLFLVVAVGLLFWIRWQASRLY